MTTDTTEYPCYCRVLFPILTFSLLAEDFEELFLSATKSFYREEYLSYSAQFSCPDYVKKVEVRFLEEAKRVNRYLSKTTEPKLRAILNSELISDHAESLVEMEYSGCRNMMKENQLDNLKGTYTQ